MNIVERGDYEEQGPTKIENLGTVSSAWTWQWENKGDRTGGAPHPHPALLLRRSPAAGTVGDELIFHSLVPWYLPGAAVGLTLIPSPWDTF